MKKRLVLLPILSMFALSGCDFSFESLMFWKKKDSSSDSGSSQTPSGTPSDTNPSDSGAAKVIYNFPQPDSSVFIQIDINDIKDHVESGKTYPTAAFDFTTDGVSFSATAGVGVKTAERSGGNFLNDNNSLQFKKDTGTVAVKEAVTATKVTVHWFATYASETSQYHPKVKTGSSASAITTSVSCNEGTTVNGVKTGGVQAKTGSDNVTKDYDVYFYTTTYTISGSSYFSVGDSGGATYIHDIWVHH